MFSLKVIDTDNFLDMSPTAQLLYFHLAMRADDDGFVSSPKRILKMANAAEDDMKVLIGKMYLIPFESGVCVIKDWAIHNFIRSDRYTKTEYRDEKSQLSEIDGKYELKSGIPNVIPLVATGKVRLGEVRLGEVKNTYGEFQNVKLKEEEYNKLLVTLGEQITKHLIEELSGYIASKGEKYKNHYATLLNWSRRKKQERNNNSKPLYVAK